MGGAATPGKAKRLNVKESLRNEAVGAELAALASRAGISQQEVDAVLEAESAEVRAVLTQFQQQVAEVRSQLEEMHAQVEGGHRPTSGGVSYLELKLQLLLSYCTHLSFYLLLKAEGQPVKGHPVIEKLVEARTYMEKLRPMDVKLKYQMDKLLKTGLEGPEGSAGSSDALNFKPNLNALKAPDFADNAGDDEGNETAGRGFGDDAGQDESVDKSGIYRPPKITVSCTVIAREHDGAKLYRLRRMPVNLENEPRVACRMRLADDAHCRRCTSRTRRRPRSGASGSGRHARRPRATSSWPCAKSLTRRPWRSRTMSRAWRTTRR